MGNEVDFMVHGYVPLNIFGHEVWLTTTHVCLLIVCLFMLVIGLIVNNKMKHATEVPGMVQNIAELYVEMMDGCGPVKYVQALGQICQLYPDNFHVPSVFQHFGSFRTQTANC